MTRLERLLVLSVILFLLASSARMIQQIYQSSQWFAVEYRQATEPDNPFEDHAM